MKELDARLEDSKFQVCSLLEELFAKGYLGRKTGRGFFVYAPQRNAGTRRISFIVLVGWRLGSVKAQITMDVSKYYHPIFFTEKMQRRDITHLYEGS